MEDNLLNYVALLTNVREKLKECDKTFFKKVNCIFSRLYGDKSKNVILSFLSYLIFFCNQVCFTAKCVSSAFC